MLFSFVNNLFCNYFRSCTVITLQLQKLKTNTQNPIVMKTTLIILIVTLLSFTSALASNNNLNNCLAEETLVNDIPFPTGEIAEAFLAKVAKAKALLTLKEEEVVNDIPFNTALIAAKVYANKFIKSLKLTDEQMVNDVPFNTQEVAEKSICWHLGPNSTLQEEQLIDDVPFNTMQIASQSLNSKQLKLKEESWINDIPFNTAEIAANSLKNQSPARDKMFAPEFSIATLRSKDNNTSKVIVNVTVNDNYQVVSVDKTKKSIQLVLSN